jgi:hypothetical protein
VFLEYVEHNKRQWKTENMRYIIRSKYPQLLKRGTQEDCSLRTARQKVRESQSAADLAHTCNPASWEWR